MSHNERRRLKHIWSASQSHLLPMTNMSDSMMHKTNVPSNNISAINHHQGIDPYQVLALRRDANYAEIVGSYRRLALLKHPRRQKHPVHSSCHNSCKNDDENEDDEGDNECNKNDSTQSLREWNFIVLSASYETLKSFRYRRAYDDLYRQQERKYLQQKQRQLRDAARQQRRLIETMHPTSNASCLTDIHGTIFGKNNNDIPQHQRTVSSTNCDVGTFLKLSFDSDDDNTHSDSLSFENSLSGADDIRNNKDLEENSDMYQGPLELLYRARNYENFSDPYQLFRTEFGSDIFSSSIQTDYTSNQDLDQVLQCRQHQSYTSPYKQRNGRTMGLAEDIISDSLGDDSPEVDHSTLGDVVVTKTSRVLHGSKITRVETVKVDPHTGKQHRVVEVLREECEDDDSSMSSDMDSSLVESFRNPILACLTRHNKHNESTASHGFMTETQSSPSTKDKLSLKTILFRCGPFIPS